MRKSLIAACLTLIISVSTLFAQQLPKTLLWRISGNGLSKPSYIYGTMHVMDPRIFILGDSLLSAMKNSDGFANELDLNQITPLIIDLVKQEISNAVLVKQVMTGKSFDKYGPALAKKFDKPANEITTFDVLREKNKWIDESFKGKKMQTFLDAYLMDLADQQGKWIGGIEDFSDQSGLMNSAVDESDIKELVLSDGSGENSGTEKMKTMYLNGDLGGFQNLINGMDSNYRDHLLIRRNHKMAFRMDSLAKVRSMLFAVGAAHLPGEEGLIRLLRARGFNVDPVFSSKLIKPEDYKIQRVVRPWVEANDPDGHYKVMMPGMPGNIRFYGVASMQLYFNIFNSTLYMTASTSLPYSGKGIDSTENRMLKQMFGGPDYKLEKKFEINGIQGKSFIQRNAGGYKRIYLFDKENAIYMAIGFSASEEETSIRAVNQFLDSYQPIQIRRDTGTKDFAYVDSNHFYGMSMPSKPNSIDNLPVSDKSIRTVLMVSTDPQPGTYYFCGFSECRKGYMFQNDSTVVNKARENLLRKLSDITRDTVYTKNNRRILELNGSMLNGTAWAKTIITVRGNRTYTVLVMYPPGKWDETMNNKLASFHLDKYAAGDWNYASAPDSLFTTWAPAGFSFWEENDKGVLSKSHYISFDSGRVHSYQMRIDTLDAYIWAKSDSSFWAHQKNRFVENSDTVLSEKIFKKDGLYQYEFLDRPKGGNNIMRMHMWLRDNLIYRMTTLQEPETIQEENVNRFFEQLHFNRPAEETRVFNSKAVLLLKDLQSTDTLISRKANKALPNAPFSTAEIPLLQRALLVSYPEDTAVTNSTNGQIAEKIIQLNDSSSVDFARKHFKEATDPESKSALMDILSAWYSNSNYDSLGKLLVESPPKFVFPKWITSKWKDSLQVAAHLFPTILPLINDTLLAAKVFSLADDLLDDSLLSMSIFHPWQQAILHYADRRFRKTLADTVYYTDADYAVISIMQRMKTDSCNAMLKKWLGVIGNAYHKQAIVLGLLKNNQTINPGVLQELAANEYTRLDLYRNLKEYKKTALFPAKYLTQSFFAESLAREAADRFSDEESDLKPLIIKEIKWNGKMSRFFFYDLFFETSNEHYLAVAGPFNINKTSISLSDADGDVYSKEQYDAKKVDKQVKQLLSQMGENQ
jgi:uncharacterized protein YbaP (TraB family)